MVDEGVRRMDGSFPVYHAGQAFVLFHASRLIVDDGLVVRNDALFDDGFGDGGSAFDILAYPIFGVAFVIVGYYFRSGKRILHGDVQFFVNVRFDDTRKTERDLSTQT